jgi:hypothetical protein
MSGAGKGGGGMSPKQAALSLPSRLKRNLRSVNTRSSSSLRPTQWRSTRGYAKKNTTSPKALHPRCGLILSRACIFFVAKVNLKKVKREGGRAVLSPLRFHYDTDTFQLPVRLGLLNARGPQDLIMSRFSKPAIRRRKPP